jgi:hypothetical protein
MRRNLLRWATALALFVTLAALCVRDYSPPLPGPLVLDLVLDPGRAGQSEPLVCAGRTGAAQFLFLRHADNDTVVFGYDNWGEGGPVSAPVKIAAGSLGSLVCGVLSVHARPPVGFFARSVLGVVALALTLRAGRAPRSAGAPLHLPAVRLPLAVAVLAAAAVLSFNGLSYLKLKNHRWLPTPAQRPI